MGLLLLLEFLRLLRYVYFYVMQPLPFLLRPIRLNSHSRVWVLSWSPDQPVMWKYLLLRVSFSSYCVCFTRLLISTPTLLIHFHQIVASIFQLTQPDPRPQSKPILLRRLRLRHERQRPRHHRSHPPSPATYGTHHSHWRRWGARHHHHGCFICSF